MRIRMLVDMAGTRDGQPWPARGETADLPTAAAAHLVASGVAEEVGGPAAVRPRPRARKKENSRAAVDDS